MFSVIFNKYRTKPFVEDRQTDIGTVRHKISFRLAQIHTIAYRQLLH